MTKFVCVQISLGYWKYSGHSFFHLRQNYDENVISLLKPKIFDHIADNVSDMLA